MAHYQTVAQRAKDLMNQAQIELKNRKAPKPITAKQDFSLENPIKAEKPRSI
jgi:hypothetical protein